MTSPGAGWSPGRRTQGTHPWGMESLGQELKRPQTAQLLQAPYFTRPQPRVCRPGARMAWLLPDLTRLPLGRGRSPRMGCGGAGEQRATPILGPAPLGLGPGRAECPLFAGWAGSVTPPGAPSCRGRSCEDNESSKISRPTTASPKATVQAHDSALLLSARCWLPGSERIPGAVYLQASRSFTCARCALNQPE